MAPSSLNDLPPEIHGPSAWYGPDLAAPATGSNNSRKRKFLRSTPRRRAWRALRPIPSIRQHDFPLPTLGPRLRGMLEDVLTGRGFVLLRRLPVDRWSPRKTAIAYFGLGTHLGRRDRRMRKATSSATSRIWATRAPTRMCHLPDKRTAGLSHRLMRCRRVALHPAGENGRAVKSGQFRDHLQRNTPAPPRPGPLPL